MLTFYDNAFSPFARKVWLALELKKLPYVAVDGLLVKNRDALAKVNGRVEVPAIDHDGVVVVGSADIVAYLERVAPAPRLHPESPAAFVHARAWERCADHAIDPILINLSYWTWAERDDAMPEGMLEAARRDLAQVYDALERDLKDRPFVSGEAISIADVALYPHLTATKTFGVGHDPATHPRLHAWLKRLRAMDPFDRDLERVKAFLASYAAEGGHERKKIFWRGDRIEWVLARGMHRWLQREIEEDRVLWPGLAIPAPRA